MLAWRVLSVCFDREPLHTDARTLCVDCCGAEGLHDFCEDCSCRDCTYGAPCVEGVLPSTATCEARHWTDDNICDDGVRCCNLPLLWWRAQDTFGDVVAKRRARSSRAPSIAYPPDSLISAGATAVGWRGSPSFLASSLQRSHPQQHLFCLSPTQPNARAMYVLVVMAHVE